MTKEEIHRRIGAAASNTTLANSAKVAAYLQAVAAWKDPGEADPLDLRREAVRQLASIMSGAEMDRDRVMAAKVLEGYLPSAKQEREILGDRPSAEVMQRLREVIVDLGDQGLQDLIDERVRYPAVFGVGAVPVEGNDVPSAGQPGNGDDAVPAGQTVEVAAVPDLKTRKPV